MANELLNDDIPAETTDLPTIESSGGTVLRFRSFDGTAIRAAYWPALGIPQGGVLMLPGRTEFIEKHLETVGTLRRRGLAVWTLDWRGQGASDRPLDNPHKGHVNDYADYLMDLQFLFITHVNGQVQGPLFLLAHSMGGLIGLRFLHDHPEPFTRAVLCAPMLGIPSGGGAAAVFARALSEAGCAIGLSGSYIPFGRDYDPHQRAFDGNPLTHDRRRFDREAAFLRRDPYLALGAPTYGWVRASLRSIARLHRPDIAAGIQVPVLIVSAGEERVVENAAQHRIVRDGLPRGRLETIAGARHEILCETDDVIARFWAHFDAFTGTAER